MAVNRKRNPTFRDLYLYIQKCRLETPDPDRRLIHHPNEHFPFRVSDNNGRPGWSFSIYSGRDEFQVRLPAYNGWAAAGVMKLSFVGDRDAICDDDKTKVVVCDVYNGFKSYDTMTIPIDTAIGGPNKWADKFIFGKPVQKLFIELLTTRRAMKVIEGDLPPDYHF